MPIHKSAKKKMRADSKKQAHNKKLKENLKGLIKNMRRTPVKESLQSVFSALDKAQKTHLIHKNKASRLKSRLSKKLVQSSATS